MSFYSTLRLGDLVLLRRWEAAPEGTRPLPALFALPRLRSAASWDASCALLMDLAEDLDGTDLDHDLGVDRERRLDSALHRVEQALHRGELKAYERIRRAPPILLDQKQAEVAPAPAPTIRELAPPPPEVEQSAPLDLQAQAATLVQAAALGVPFCEECEKARGARKAA